MRKEKRFSVKSLKKTREVLWESLSEEYLQLLQLSRKQFVMEELRFLEDLIEKELSLLQKNLTQETCLLHSS
jgi:hypothetical protein